MHCRFSVADDAVSDGWNASEVLGGLSSEDVICDEPPLLPLAAVVVIVVVLLALSGLFSGLTLGLMSLDRLNLQVSEKSGEPNERKWAAAIRPLRDQGNLLLCTLLLGNTLVNSGVSILLDSISSGAIAVFVATMCILLFGEILPQAICVRFGLAIGAAFKPVVYFFMLLFWPITWPISKVLDKLLGRDIGVVYSQQELKQLISLHCEDPDAVEESGLTREDHKLITGVFDYKEKRVMDVMTKTVNVFMLEEKTRLSPQVMLQIYRMGFTRIPVYREYRENIVGLLYTKDLILIDPDDDVELSTIISLREAAQEEAAEKSILKMLVNDTTKLDVVMKMFKARCSHMLFATSSGEVDGAVTVTGIITLEDVLEELLNDEIIDESDNVVDTNHPEQTVVVPKKKRLDLSRIFENMYLPFSQQLSVDEASAVVAYLVASTAEFKLFKECEIALLGLINNHSEVVEIGCEDDDESLASSVGSTNRNDAPTGTTIYKQGEATDKFTLILQGKVMIESGFERFQSSLGPWSKLCEKALSRETHVPDFTATVMTSQPCRLLQVSRSSYVAAVRAAKVEARVGKLHVMKQLTKGCKTNNNGSSSNLANQVQAPTHQQHQPQPPTYPSPDQIDSTTSTPGSSGHQDIEVEVEMKHLLP